MMTPSATRGQAPDLFGAKTTRFAPSPTGALHLGHAFSAIMAHDLARAAGGRFLLRIEDIDGARSRPEHVAGIVADLEWLGLAWDGPVVFQSARVALYADALERLRTLDLLYPCFCTRADIAREIAASLSAPHATCEAPVYPRTCRTLDTATASRRRAVEPHAWRIDMDRAVAMAGPLNWHDLLAGVIDADPISHGDVVLARKDAPASYHLAVTIDDAAQNVSDVVRGDDLFTATHIHRLLQALLDLPTPKYHHHPLLRDAEGRRLAKRDGAPALSAMRQAGAKGAAVCAMLRESIETGRLPIGIGEPIA